MSAVPTWMGLMSARHSPPGPLIVPAYASLPRSDLTIGASAGMTGKPDSCKSMSIGDSPFSVELTRSRSTSSSETIWALPVTSASWVFGVSLWVASRLSSAFRRTSAATTARVPSAGAETVRPTFPVLKKM